MSKYDDLLDRARKAAEVFRASAGEFVPKMYEALRKEGVDAADAKDRIEKDLAGVWSKDTIRRQIPDEAKNQKISENAKRVNAKKHAKDHALREPYYPRATTEKDGKNPISEDKPLISIANTGEQELTIANNDKPEIISEPYARGAKRDREATYTEKQAYRIKELSDLLAHKDRIIIDLQKHVDKSGYSADVTQELIDAQIKIKKLEEGYQVNSLVEVAGQQLPVIVYVRPSAKSAKVVVDESAYKEMYA